MSSSNPSTPPAETGAARSKQLLNRAYSSMSRATSSSKANSTATLSQIKSNLSTHTSTSVKQAVARGEQIPFKTVFAYPASTAQVRNLSKDHSSSNLTSDQVIKYDLMLQYFREMASEGGKGFPKGLKPPLSQQFEPPTVFEKLRLLCKESLLRYLRASKWDLPTAKKRLTDTIAWRREFGVDHITADQVEEEAKCGKESVLGYDNLGRPLHMMHPHRNNTKESERQMQFAVWILERCIDLMPPGVEQLALLINFDSRSRNPTSIANAKLMLYILQNHYVERLGVALCINVPWVFKMFWNAIQSFIDPHTKSKCKFDEAIKDEVPPQQLTTDFGGMLSFPYNEDPELHQKYWSQLIKLCDDRRLEMERRFKEECGEEVGASEWVILGGDERRGSKSSEDENEEENQGGNEVNGFTGLKPVNTGSTTTSASFKTPSENLNKNPLERHFSSTPSEANASLNGVATAGISSATVSTPAAEAADAAALEPTTEKPAEEEAEELEKEFNSTPVKANGNSNHEKEKAKEKQKEKGFSKFMHNTFKKTEDSFHKLDDLVHHRNSGDSNRNAKASPQKRNSTGLNGSQSKGLNGNAVAAAAGALSGATTAGTIKVNGAAGAHEATKEEAKDKIDVSKSDSQAVKVLFFASSREAAGTSQVSITLPSKPDSESISESTSLQKLPDLILLQLSSTGEEAGSSPDLEELERLLKDRDSGVRWSVNEEMVDEEQIEDFVLRGGEEVAVIPPVSGG